MRSSSLVGRWRRSLGLWAGAVRDSYVALLPLTFIGVLATLVQHLPLPGLGQSLGQWCGPLVEQTIAHLLDASQGVFALALAVALCVHLGRRLAGHSAEAPPPFWLAIGGLVDYMLCVLAQGQTPGDALGQGSALLALAVGTLTPIVLLHLSRLGGPWLLRLPYDSDPVFLQSTRLTLPLLGCALLTLVLSRLGLAAWQGLAEAAGRLADLATLVPGGGWRTVFITTVNQLLWSVGIHGGKVVDSALAALYTPHGQPYDAAQAWRPLIDNFVLLGGSGATLGLLIALLWVVREGPQRRLAQASLLPSLFNVNELLVFGLPVVLHPRYLLPFVAVPVALAGAGWWLVDAGWMPVRNVTVHWTTPALLSGWQLTGSWQGPLWQALGIAFSAACYLPVVRRVEQERRQHQQQAMEAAVKAILGTRQDHRRALQRPDQVGEIARGLLHDLAAALHTPAVHVAYQPKQRADGTAIGAEALVRWTHRRYGPIRADVLVTLAEEGALIQALGRRVLDDACACKARWNAAGLTGLTMAVNVSPLQLEDAGFAQDVIATLQRHGLQGPELELEVTESHALPLGPTMHANMRALSAHGVRLAMDDFGMGHASLLHLRHFNVHAIKIDGSLCRDVLQSDALADIVRSIALLGQSRQLEVVAEFVETAAQRDALAALGCTAFQGYLFSPALSEAECTRYLLRPRTGVAVAHPASAPAVEPAIA